MNKREALIELTRRKLIEDWRQDPLLWYKERFGGNPKDFLWSDIGGAYDKHIFDGDKDPLANAWRHIGKVYAEVKAGKTPTQNNIALESGTGTGKTYWLARVVFWFLDCFENSLVVTSAPSEAQLKLGLWAELDMIYHRIKVLRPTAQKWKTRLAINSMQNRGVGNFQPDILQGESWHAVAFTTGYNADTISADRARGFHRPYMLIVLEECTGIPYPILTAFQNTTTGNLNYILAVGNPSSKADTLHRLVEQKDCKSYRISAYDHPNIVLGREHFKGSVTQSKIISRRDIYGEDSPLFNAMIRGISPQQGEDSLIKKEWIEECINKNNVDTEKTYNAVGVDVANSEAGDKGATAWGRGNTLLAIYEFVCNNATHLAYNIVMDSINLKIKKAYNYGLPTISEYNILPAQIGVDAVGVGVATINAFLDLGMQVQGLDGGEWKEVIPSQDNFNGGVIRKIPMYSFSNLRSQMFWALREDIRLKNININLEKDDKVMIQQVIKELCNIRMIGGKSKIIIEGKAEIKKRLGGKSPNIADAIAYWNWVRKGYRKKKKKNIMDIYSGKQ